MLWADKEPASGPLHLNFKLSAEVSQKIQLILPYAGKEEVIDEVTIQKHEQNGSYGRKTDGSSDLTVFEVCTHSNIGNQLATPTTENGSRVCTDQLAGVSDVDSDETVYPNPTNSEWTINVDGEYVVSNMVGQVIESGDAYAGMSFGGDYKAGVYLLKIDGKVIKLVKK